MLELCEQIVARCAAGERLALCVVVGARGSTPQAAGAKMLVLGDGRTVGTLGGGCVEAEVRRRALELLPAAAAAGGKLLTFRLDNDYGWDDGLVCGGIMDIAVRVLSTPADAEPFRHIADALRASRPAQFVFPYEADDGARQQYAETIEPPPVLVIAGAGHVGQALGALAATLSFDVAVIDDRADFASPARFPAAKRHVVGDIETELGRFPIDERTFVVIVTRGHRHDGQALGAVINSPAKYLGLIGSRRKIRRILEDLAERGVPRERLARVHAPIGLEIGAVTVPEIAVSIAAELIAVRHGRQGQPARPLKLRPEELATWLDREALRGG